MNDVLDLSKAVPIPISCIGYEFFVPTARARTPAPTFVFPYEPV
jgi:hypothetical protein